jgi:hypothetical protein
MKDAIFYDQKWHLQKVKSVIWKSLLDYDRVAWERWEASWVVFGWPPKGFYQLSGLVERLGRSGGGCSLPFRNEFFICVLI